MDNMDKKTSVPEEKFMLLFSLNHHRIYTYILSVLGVRSVVDDIMQQTLLAMWRTFSKFEEGTNFAAWGKTIAQYEIMTYRKKQARELLLDNESLQKIMDQYDEVHDHSDERQKAMDGCLKKISEHNLKLIRLRYHEGRTCKQISEQLSRPAVTIYKRFATIHASLQECISRTLEIWERQF